MITLLIDTAFESCQVALARGETLLDSSVVQSGGGHDRVLATMTRDLLQRQHINVSQLDKIAVTTGPGRFNGLRVGIAFARGLALVHRTPLIGLMTSDVFSCDAASVSPSTVTAIIMDVKRGEHYVVLAGDSAKVIHRVVGDDLVAFLQQHSCRDVMGYLSPPTQVLLTEKKFQILPNSAAPQLESMARLVAQDKSLCDAPVRPYYGAA
jgi:tRNA threonylcarbamoyl adenosine modification protein YeaZ